MKPITKTLLLLALNFTVLIPLSLFAQSSGYSKEVQDRILKVEQSLAGTVVVEGDSLWTLKQRMQYHQIPAVSIAVVKDFKIDWAKAYGYADVAEKRIASPSTRFQAASISKSLNAMAMLKLVQDKKIDLYADINTYLSSWKFPYDSLSKNKKISLANLLSHTAGLTVHGFGGYKQGDKIPSVIEVLNGTAPANSAAVRSNAEPGIKSVYSGGGTTISQLIAMDVSKKPYQDFALQTVLKPLGMNHSFYYQHPSLGQAKDVATAFRADGNAVPGKYHTYPEMAPQPYGPPQQIWLNSSSKHSFPCRASPIKYFPRKPPGSCLHHTSIARRLWVYSFKSWANKTILVMAGPTKVSVASISEAWTAETAL